MAKGKGSTEESLYRILLILQMLPISAPGLRVKDIKERLVEESIEVTERTIQRDLAAAQLNSDDEESDPHKMKMSQIFQRFGIELQSTPDEEGVARWQHSPGSTRLPVNRLLVEQFLLLSLLKKQAWHFWPRSIYGEMESFFLHALSQVNKGPDKRKINQFLDKIASIQPGYPRVPININPTYFSAVNSALLSECQVSFSYQGNGRSKSSDYRVHPIGLVQQGCKYWLVAVKDEDIVPDKRTEHFKDKVRTFALHRATGEMSVLKYEGVAKNLPSLKDVLDSGTLAFSPAGFVTLKLQFENSLIGKQMADNFRELALSEDQQFQTIDGHEILTATVIDSGELVWMLYGICHTAKILAPENIATKVRDFAREAYRLHCVA